jgi:hypothetical protein
MQHPINITQIKCLEKLNYKQRILKMKEFQRVIQARFGGNKLSSLGRRVEPVGAGLELISPCRTNYEFQFDVAHKLGLISKYTVS